MKENQELIRTFAYYKKIASGKKRIILILGMILAFLTFALFSIFSNENLVTWLYSIPIVLIEICILILVLNLMLNKINKDFKDEFLKKLVKILDFEAMYTYDSIITKEDLSDSSILSFNDLYSYKFEEMISGKIYDYKFKSAFLKIKKKDKNVNYIPFVGRIFVIDYLDNQDFFIYEKNNDYAPKLKDPKYEDKFISIYSNNYEKAKRILRNNVIKNLSKLIENKKMKVTVEFKCNKIFITTWNKKEQYALSEMNTINNIQQAYIHEMNVMKEIIDTLEI